MTGRDSGLGPQRFRGKNAWMKSPLALLIVAAFATSSLAHADDPAIDWQRARELYRRAKSGEKLSPEDQAYVEHAKAARGRSEKKPGGPAPKLPEGLVPLCDMGAGTRYQGEDGGLYGSGKNSPPDSHRTAATAALAKVQPLGRDGKPAADGKIVLVSISMSNATQEFSTFKHVADADPRKSPKLTIVDCAQGGQAMAEWAPRDGQPWAVAKARISAAGVTPEQVQVAWIKLANKHPQGAFTEHGRKLEKDTGAVLQNARALFPNLRVAYLGSRIYGGYAAGGLNPEPYAYESAFVVRWLIQRQMKGDAALAVDKMPVLLWGPYFWADGAKGRKIDKLVWERPDFAGDGTHPSESGRMKVARMLLEFFATDSLAKSWFAGQPAE